MKTSNNVDLAPFTSLGVGGIADTIIEIETHDDVATILSDLGHPQPLWILGYGTNALISDQGLPGTVLHLRSQSPPSMEGTMVTVDPGMQWDQFVQFCISKGLWGLEFTSGVPGGVGAAVAINITAYGQRVSETLAWAEVLDSRTGKVSRLAPDDLKFSYKDSRLHRDTHLIVTKAAFKLSHQPTTELKYESALKIADELGLTPHTLEDRRKIILETRKRAGSMWNQDDPNREHTAGSFFKNPLVSADKAEELAGFEETDITREKLLEQNRIHGGADRRVSAAHVLLAAGYKRGQSWGPVRLHPQHVLKIENTGGATAQQIYDVAAEIIRTVDEKLEIQLEPEVRFLGEF